MDALKLRLGPFTHSSKLLAGALPRSLEFCLQFSNERVDTSLSLVGVIAINGHVGAALL